MSAPTTTTAYERTLDALGEHGVKVRANGTSAMAQCPAHDDHNPSLSLRAIEGAALLHCHAGCRNDDVLAALNLAKSDLYDEPAGARYDYVDRAGTVLRSVHRTPQKAFRQSGDTKGTAPLYRLPAVAQAVQDGTPVYVCEGEADVLALESLGVVATTSPMGASNAHRADWAPLHGAHVVLVPDRDEAGQRYCRDVLAQLDGKAASVKIALAKVGKDASDHVAAGHTLDELEAAELPGLEEPDDDDDPLLRRLCAGDRFILDAPDQVPAVWGTGNDVVWAEGEALTVAGPPGVGKTTIFGQLVRARLGLVDNVLGWPVAPTTSRVLYLAMDRPQQIARALRRVFRNTDRDVLADRLVVWPGPPPGDLAKHPETLTVLARKAGADTVFIDSMKDAAVGLVDDDTAAAYNRARQLALVEGVQVAESHHMVKRGAGGAKPTTLADVYGSMHLTAGSGSVVLLWGAAGDPIVDLTHLKQPAGEVGPVRVIHDHHAGTSDIWHGTDLLVVAQAAGQSGLTAKAAAAALYSTDKPDPSQTEKARRRLVNLARGGQLTERPGFGQDPAQWHLTGPHGDLTVTSRREGGHADLTTSRADTSSQVTDLTGDLTHLTPPLTSRSTTPLGVDREVRPQKHEQITDADVGNCSRCHAQGVHLVGTDRRGRPSCADCCTTPTKEAP